MLCIVQRGSTDQGLLGEGPLQTFQPAKEGRGTAQNSWEELSRRVLLREPGGRLREGFAALATVGEAMMMPGNPKHPAGYWQ